MSDIAKKMLDSLSRPIIEAMDKEGMTLEYLMKKLKKELEAKETKFFAFQGKVISKRDVIAWGVRQNARQDANKLRGDYAPEKHEHSFSDDLIETLTQAKAKSRGEHETE
jgi:hypothetical protein